MRLIGSGLARYGSRIRVAMILTALLVAGSLALRIDRNAPRATSFDPQYVRANFGRLPLAFEPNQGQSDPRVKFLAHGSNYGFFLTADQAVLALHKSPTQVAVVRMALAGANANAAAVAADPLPGKSNYFIGNNPAQWHRNIPQFARVRYQGVYPGVDLVYYGNQGRLEYDLEVAPNADTSQVAVRFPGIEKLRLDNHGDLVIPAGDGEIRLQAPVVYQKLGNERRSVAGRFVLRSASEVGFEIGSYDHSRTLVIDPQLVYSTFLGGTNNEACSAITGTGIPQPRCPAIAVDGAASAYVAGSTNSTDFPTVQGALAMGIFQTTLNGTANLYVTKLDPTGSAVVFSTYVGGDGIDLTGGIAIDSAFRVNLAGTTTSSNFPTLSGFQDTPVAAGTHAFVTQVQNDGSALTYSTYLSGNGTDTATGIALDFQQTIYVTGTTTSTNFPVFPNPGAFQTTPKATNQFFLTTINPRQAGASSLVYSTYFGGSTPATGVAVGGGIAVDINTATPGVYFTGGTDFSDMPALNSFQPYQAGKDVFLAKFTFFPNQPNTPPVLSYMTYLGGTGDDIGTGVAVDQSFNAYVTGSTTSPDFGHPTSTSTPPAYQPCLDAPNVFPPTACPTGLTASDAFVAKVLPCSGTSCSASSTVQLLYFSYLGGSGTDVGTDIGLDLIQGARITGWTNSTDLHVTNPLPTVGSALNGGTDAFVARMDTLATTASSTSYAVSYLGGSGNDAGTGVAVDLSSNTYVAGETASGNFPALNPYQASLSGASDAFVSKVGPKVAFTMAATAMGSQGGAQTGVGNQVTYSYLITNTGDAASGVTFTDFVPTTGATFAGTNSNACGGVSSGVVTCNLGTLNTGTMVTIQVFLVPTVPGALSNTAQVTATGATGVAASAGATVIVNDFGVTVSPASQTVPAGLPATYTITVNTIPQNSSIPSSISLGVGSGLPAGTNTNFTVNPLPSLASGSGTTTLTIGTTMRTTTITQRWGHGGPLYATWLPVSGLALLGLGIGGKVSRRRRLFGGLLLAILLVLIGLLPACSSSRQNSVTNGTPAGTYTLTVTGTSGTVAHATSFTLVVQ